MAIITFDGKPMNTAGDLPRIGTKAPDFLLTKTDLSSVALKDFAGKKVVMNIFPSIDTPICAASVRRFNKEAGGMDNTAVLCVSMDLPFAHERFRGAEGLKNVISASAFRNASFGDAYGVRIVDGPLAGLLSRAVVVLDAQGTVVHAQQVPEITEEPDYEGALKSL
ncbi:MAG: thiol peroxidase [Nitrospinae bacterium]|nr:thiol peroxidase [Nitrospinota bacterium]